MNSFTPTIKPSPRFFFPKNGKLFSYSTLSSAETRSAVQGIDEKLLQLASETHYPRPITRLALKRKEYRIGVYSKLGEKDLIAELRRDLQFFQNEQEISESPYLTFIAVFHGSKFDSEGAFEMAFWKHLSLLMSEKEFSTLWNSRHEVTNDEKDLWLNFDGLSYSVMGMHPYSSKESRRFSETILVFNLHEQFEQLGEQFKPQPIVAHFEKSGRNKTDSLNI